MISKCKRIYQIGLRKSAIIGVHRMRQWYFAYYWRKNISAYKPTLLPISSKIKQLPFVHTLCNKQDHAACIDQADAIVAGWLSILGSKKQIYNNMPWHTDIRLAQQDAGADRTFAPDSFYQDITITSGITNILHKDIKVPWELSRAQQLSLLGHAYICTKNEACAKKIIEWCVSWIQDNSFLYGVNWCNPMEVGLRVLNWIIALSMIRESSTVDSYFIHKITNSLYEHLIFIEGNWEWYDGKTSNHYLSDLVGYLYLSWFFNDKKRTRWAVAELEREMRKQVLSDGASYEGSTRYHRLVTELFYYAKLLVENETIQLSDVFFKKYKQMHAFLWWCTPNNGTLIAIGDDDSGCVTLFGYKNCFDVGLQVKESQKKYFDFAVLRSARTGGRVMSQIAGVGSDYKKKAQINPSPFALSKAEGRRRRVKYFNYFRDFGLSIYKSSKVHATLRHHAYNANQPSGHFHNDVGSITLTIGGVPIIVDPGSYVYTPSVYWRNYFRSVCVHNSSYIRDIEPIELSGNLFYLGLQEEPESNDDIFYVQQQQYKKQGALLERHLECTDTQINILDAWRIETFSTHTLCWNFTLHPEISVELHGNEVMLKHHERAIATVHSDQLQFCIENAFFAPSYGQKKATKCIRAYLPFATIKTKIIILV